MYISNYEFIHGAGYANHINPSVKLSIEDCANSDLEAIQRLANDKRYIKIYDRETLEFAISSRLRTNGYGIRKLELTTKCTDIKVEKVIYHNPATIVFWSDGTKTVVKCGKDDTYDKEKGFYIACAKKLFGNDYKAVGRMNKALMMAETKE